MRLKHGEPSEGIGIYEIAKSNNFIDDIYRVYTHRDIPMSRPRVHRTRPVKVLISIQKKVHELATTKANSEQFAGGFSEYVARLLIADMKKKRSVAHRNGRFLKEVS